MAKFEDMTAVLDHLLGSLEIGIEVAFPADQGTTVVVAPVEDAGVAIALTTLAIELDHIVLVVDGMDVDIGAVRGGTVESAFLELEDPSAFRTVHIGMSKVL